MNNILDFLNIKDRVTAPNNVVDEISQLSEKLLYETATVEDYEKYIKLLQEGGFTKQHIDEGLKKHKISNWSKFLLEAKLANTDEDIIRINKAIGWLIALGLAVVLYNRLK